MGSFIPQEDQRYEMPASFGPVPLDAIRYQDVTRVVVPFRTTVEALASLLPPGLVPSEEPVVTVSYQKVREVSFLNGGGYNIIAVDLAADYVGSDGQRVSGSYPPVVWEDDVYSIIVGREPFGVAKIFGDIPSTDRDGETWRFECSEFGSRLLAGSVTGLVEMSGAEREAVATAAANPSAATFRWKQVPHSTGEPATSYLMSGNRMSLVGLTQAWTGEGAIEFFTPSRVEAPVAHRYMRALRGLEVVDCLPASVIRGTVEIQQWSGQPLPSDGDVAIPAHSARITEADAKEGATA